MSQVRFERIYVCHTYYNVFVTILKEFNYQKTNGNKGVLALSLMSTDFKDLKLRLEQTGLFQEVVELNEVHPYNFERKFKFDISGSKWWNPLQWYINWVLYWRYIAKETATFVNIDFTGFKQVFVYCDLDPIGKYLNYKRIPYIAVEDGLEAVRINDPGKHERLLGFKVVLANLGITFMRDGFSHYAKGIEVNSAKGLYSFGRNILEVPRKELFNALNDDEKGKLYDVFWRKTNFGSLNLNKKNAMLLAGKLGNEVDSFSIYRDIIAEFCQGYNVIIKPHPIDESDYEKEFPDCIVLERFFPLEIFNVKCELEIDRIISVTSVLDDYTFAKEKIRLGLEFLKKYDYPDILKQPNDLNQNNR